MIERGLAMGSDIRDNFIREGAERELWREGDAIVVAVSGGPDSMALLHLFHSIAEEQRLRLLAAHVNHGFRGAESERELRLVREYGERLGIPCETVALDLPTYIEENRLNLQAAAREKRYEFLAAAASRHGARTIALAHHADDQAETVLMRLIRGAGPTGLSGMADKRREKNMELIRPLLRMNKSDLLRYCEEKSIPYCTDSSNLERYYFRNTVRLDILPYLSQFNPQLSQSLQRLAEVAGAEEDYMDARTKESFARMVDAGREHCAVSCEALTGLHVALQRRLIKLILSYLSQDTENFTFEAIEKMRLAAMPDAPSTWRTDIGGDLVCIREYDKLRWLKRGVAAPASDGYSYVIEPGQTFLDAAPSGWSFRLQWPKEREADEPKPSRHERPSSRFEACFDVTALALPLTVRSRLPGDRIQVLGLNGSKKVQDMFVDEKVPPSRRELYPLLCDAEGRLLWIPGIRRSAHALAREGRSGLLHIAARNE